MPVTDLITNLIENFDEIIILLMVLMIAISIYWMLACRKRSRLAKFTPEDGNGRSVIVYNSQNTVGCMFFHDVRFKRHGSANQCGGRLNRVMETRAAIREVGGESDGETFADALSPSDHLLYSQPADDPSASTQDVGTQSLIALMKDDPPVIGRPAAKPPGSAAQPCWMFYPKHGEPSEMEHGQSYDCFGKGYIFSVCDNILPRGHFIAIFLLCLCSLTTQLYFAILAGFSSGDGYPFANVLSALQTPAQNILSGDITPGLIPYASLFMLEAIILGFLGISRPRRLTPEIVLSFFLIYIGYVLFPGEKTFFLVACIMLWRFGAVLIARLADRHEWVWTVCAAVVIISAVVFIGLSFESGAHDSGVYADDVELMRVYSAAGGIKGVGLYAGVFRDFAPPAFAVGVIIEELGLYTCGLLVLMCLLVSWGWLIVGLRAWKRVPGMICCASALIFAACVAVNAICVTSPGFTLPLPFLSPDVSLTILFVLCLTVCDAVKISTYNQRS
jgi:cell division protein FtsW (lipid II flippase)